jgi:putative oxidoreductase
MLLSALTRGDLGLLIAVTLAVESLQGRNSTMLERLIRTEEDGTLALLRVVLGVVFLAHGAQKVLGWFGGAGLQGTIEFFAQQLHIPAPLAVVAIAAEFLGGLALVLGLFGRLAAAAIAVEMVVAVALAHLPNGFFMNWFGNQRGEGFEYHLLVLAMAGTLIARGSGAWSLDHLWEQALQKGGRVLRPSSAQ